MNRPARVAATALGAALTAGFLGSATMAAAIPSAGSIWEWGSVSPQSSATSAEAAGWGWSAPQSSATSAEAAGWGWSAPQSSPTGGVGA